MMSLSSFENKMMMILLQSQKENLLGPFWQYQ